MLGSPVDNDIKHGRLVVAAISSEKLPTSLCANSTISPRWNAQWPPACYQPRGVRSGNSECDYVEQDKWRSDYLDVGKIIYKVEFFRQTIYFSVVIAIFYYWIG